MLWTAATPAGSPIMYGRFRPRSEELPKGTNKKSDRAWERATSCAAEELQVNRKK